MQAGKNGKAGQGIICRGNEKDDGDERRDERKKKRREETREKTEGSTGEAEKREAGGGCVGGGVPPAEIDQWPAARVLPGFWLLRFWSLLFPVLLKLPYSPSARRDCVPSQPWGTGGWAWLCNRHRCPIG